MRVPAEKVRVYLVTLQRRASEKRLRPADVLTLQALSLAGREERVDLALLAAVTGGTPREEGQRIQRMKRRGFADSVRDSVRLTELGARVLEELEADD